MLGPRPAEPGCTSCVVRPATQRSRHMRGTSSPAFVSHCRDGRAAEHQDLQGRNTQMQSLSNDGAQQNLVALAVQLRLARQLLGRDSALVRSVFDDLDRQTKDALGTLRDLARGIFPPMLADRGLVGAL